MTAEPLLCAQVCEPFMVDGRRAGERIILPAGRARELAVRGAVRLLDDDEGNEL